jgi:hypothetical protein
MEALDRHGYQATSDCSSGTQDGAPHAGTSRWLLTIRVDALGVAGALITGSLFDSQANKEVWKDTVIPNFGGRYKNAWKYSNGGVMVNDLVSSAFPALFATFQTRKNKR